MAAAAAAFLAKGVKVVTLHTLCLGENVLEPQLEKDTSEGLQFPATPDWALNKQLTDKRGRHGAGRLVTDTRLTGIAPDRAYGPPFLPTRRKVYTFHKVAVEF